MNTKEKRNYANEIMKYVGCPSCAYTNHEFKLPCGIAYENERFIISQDWELPIKGFFVINPKRCVEKLNELTREERTEMFDLLDKTIVILRENNICDRFDVIFEEKENRHFHIWIMPRHEWMKELGGDIIANIDQVFNYAKSNFRNEETYEEIKRITEVVKRNF